MKSYPTDYDPTGARVRVGTARRSPKGPAFLTPTRTTSPSN